MVLVDCDDVLAGRVEGRVVHMLWCNNPGNHYLTVSYEIAREEPFVLPKTRRMVVFPKPDWSKEGF
jgi:hypothetical protein